MKSISVALKAHLASTQQTTCTCCKVTLTNGTILGFTSLDMNLVIDSVTYLAGGLTLSAIDTTDALNVDNAEAKGFLDHSSITEEELMAGIWDSAACELFLVNYKDLSMGAVELRSGTIGQITEGRLTFQTELRGKMQAYQQGFGRLYGIDCGWDLGDSNCKVELGGSPGLTVTGTVTSVASSHVFTDSGRSESTAAVVATITGITKALPGVLTVVAHAFADRQSIQIAGVSGMTQVNGGIYSVNVQDVDHVAINLDTTNANTYTSGGTATLIDTGYFGYGVLTWLTGANAELQQDVKLYANGGTFTLALPAPYAIVVGDTYSVYPGCDKRATTCANKFHNILNFGGFPEVPGSDKLFQVGASVN